MKILWNILLGIFSFLCIAALVFQGFVLPSFSLTLSVLLRLGAAFCAQWLFARVFRKKWLRYLPVLLTAMAAVWGFFLYLTSPSWRNATFGLFMADYASPALSCAAFWGLNWLLPRLWPSLKHAVKRFRKRRKKSKASKKDMPRFR